MFRFIKLCMTLTLAIALQVPAPTFAGDEPLEISERITNGNPVAGKEKAALCQGCHGENGISIMPNIPNLAGQWGAYIMRELRDFGTGSRSDPIMTDMAGTVSSGVDSFDIAAYFGSQKQMHNIPHENDTGKRLFIIYRCISCHGFEGQGHPLNNPIFPVIGGQHKEYLIKQLDDFRTGLRETDMSGTMPILAKRLSAAETEAIADYLDGISEVPTPAPAPVPKPVVDLPVSAPLVTDITPPAPLVIPDTWKTLLEDKPIMIEGTNFVVDSAKLRPIANKQLNGLVLFAKTYPDAVLNIVGHTDNTGTEKHNMTLSLARAVSVKKFMIKQGIAAERILTKGEAASNPIADNKTIGGRAKNRRVEISSTIKEIKKILVKGQSSGPLSSK